MTGQISAGMLRATLAALPTQPTDGLRLREVHEGVGCWARTSIAKALAELVRQGRANFFVRGGNRSYWRKQ